MADYYVSAAGNDSNEGTLASPWQTLNKLNAALSGMGLNNQVFLRRGDTFYGVIRPLASLNPLSPGWLRIGAYGSGAHPIVSGYKMLNIPSGWVAHDANTWKINISAANSGVTYTGYDSAQGPGNVGILRVDGIIHAYNRNTLAELANQWDYYTDGIHHAGTTLYVRSTAKPTTLAADIRATVDVDGVVAYNGTEVADIDFLGFGGCGVFFAPGRRNRLLRCICRDIGGSYLVDGVRYGNGVQAWGQDTGNRDIYCEYNTCFDCYDTAYSTQGGASGTTVSSYIDITWRRNLTYRSCQAEEYWYQGPPPGGGFINVVSEYNTNLFCGYGFGADTRPDTLVRAGQLSYLWGNPSGHVADLTIRHNIYYDCRGSFCYNAYPTLGQQSDRNVILLRPGVKMRYQDTQAIEQAAAWSAVSGREQNSIVGILPASSDVSISDADVATAIANLDGYAKTGQLFGGKVMPIHSPWRAA